MIHQLNPPIPVITPKGKAIAHVVIDMGIEHDLQWICFQDATGECWTWSNPQIRAQINITLGRDYISPFYHPSEVAFKKEADEDEEDEDEDEDEEIDWKAAYDEKDEEHRESRRVIIELRQEHNGLKESIKQLVNSINQDEREEDDEEVQEEECDEECEESSEEEDSYYSEYTSEKCARGIAEASLEAANAKIKKLEETNETIKETKRAIFELQDILMRLLKFKKIASEEVGNVISILRNCGVSNGDIDVICKGQIK